MVIEEIPIGKFGYVRGQVVEWFSSRWKLLGSMGMVLLALIVGIARLTEGGNAQVDFVAAEMTYNKWEGSKEALVKLEKLIRRHPELHAKYDGAIAQKLLNSSERGLANGYAMATLKRVGDSHYTTFAKGSLMIAEGKFAEALVGAKELKMKMEEDTPFWKQKSDLVRHGALLYAYNLMRIAMLEKAAGTAQGELAAWKDVREKSGKYDEEAYRLVQQNFQKEEVSLLDYIKSREKELTLVKSP